MKAGTHRFLRCIWGVVVLALGDLQIEHGLALGLVFRLNDLLRLVRVGGLGELSPVIANSAGVVFLVSADR